MDLIKKGILYPSILLDAALRTKQCCMGTICTNDIHHHLHPALLMNLGRIAHSHNTHLNKAFCFPASKLLEIAILRLTDLNCTCTAHVVNTARVRDLSLAGTINAKTVWAPGISMQFR